MSLKSTFKGFLGETVINVAMWLKLDKEVYHRLNNITLPLSNGGSTQIDHVIVSVYGIFVIETKNYKGWIYGSEKQRQWTQAFANGSKFKFQNPLRQNYLHIKTLADLLALDTSYFHSMIAFIGECEIKTRDELPEHVLTSGMVSYVKKKQDKILTEAEMQSIVEQIENNRFTKSWRTNRQHKAYLKNKHSTSVKPDIKSSTIVTAALSSDEIVSIESESKAEVKTKEVVGWSGQVEHDDLSTMPFTHKNTVFLTPFEVVETTDINITTNEIVSTNIVEHNATESKSMGKGNNKLNIPSCPKCNSEMVQRTAKKGARQGQIFYGCSQFPKCRGVVNSVAG